MILTCSIFCRDQIHKLACNHWLTDDMKLKPMSTSTTAWTWFAMDFSQGELVSESFAVRFKTDEPASLFKKKFEECQAALKNATSPVKAAVTEPSVVQVAAPAAPIAQLAETTHEQGEEGEYEEEDEETAEEDPEEEEEYEDVEESIMFEKRCTLSSLEGGAEKSWTLLGTGNLKIVYDDEMLCARIVVEDVNEQLLCDNVIAIETQLKV